MVDGGVAEQNQADAASGRTGLYLVLLAVVLVYLPTLRYPFVALDDGLHVYANPLLNPVTPTGLSQFWTHAYCGLYAPIAYMAFAGISILARMGHVIATPEGTFTNLDPHLFHTVNVLIHLANTGLVYAILRRCSQGNVAAALGAGMFGLHPLQVESVAWISELRGLLGTFFGLGAILTYLRLESVSLRSGRGAWTYASASLLFLLAILSKPSAVVVPLVVWLLVRNIDRRRLALRLAPWAIASAMLIWATRGAQPVGPWIVPIAARPLIASDSLAFYWEKLLMPGHLALVYGRTPGTVLRLWSTWIVWLVPIATVLAAIRLRRYRPLTAQGIAVFAVCLIPTLGLVPFLYQYFSTVADRYAYMAMLGPAMIVADIVSIQPRRLPKLATILVLALAVLAALQVRVWKDSRALLTHSLAVFPSTAPIQDDLAAVLKSDGEYAEAERHYRAAISVDPRFAPPYMHLEKLLLAEGRNVDAGDLYRQFRVAASRGPIVAPSLNDFPFDPNRHPKT